MLVDLACLIPYILPLVCVYMKMLGLCVFDGDYVLIA